MPCVCVLQNAVERWRVCKVSDGTLLQRGAGSVSVRHTLLRNVWWSFCGLANCRGGGRYLAQRRVPPSTQPFSVCPLFLKGEVAAVISSVWALKGEVAAVIQCFGS